MTTKNVVPRLDGEGGIGTSVKKWLNGFFKGLTVENNAAIGGNLSVPTINSRNADYGWRQNSTEYAVGNMVKTPSLPSQWCLVCTTAGTSGANEPSYSGVSVGDSVSDGSVTWMVADYFYTSVKTYNAASVITPVSATAITGTVKVIGGHIALLDIDAEMPSISVSTDYHNFNVTYPQTVGTLATYYLGQYFIPQTNTILSVGDSISDTGIYAKIDTNNLIGLYVTSSSQSARPYHISGMYWI